MWRKGNIAALLVGMVHQLWKTLWRVLKNVNNSGTTWSSSSLPGIYRKGMESLSQEGICTPMFIAVLFTIEKT